MRGKYDYLACGGIKRAKLLGETRHHIPCVHQWSLLCASLAKSNLLSVKIALFF